MSTDSQLEILMHQCIEVLYQSIERMANKSKLLTKKEFNRDLRIYWKQKVSGGDKVFDDVYEREEEFLYQHYTKMWLSNQPPGDNMLQ